MPHAAIVVIDHLRECAYLMVFAGMIEPSRTYGYIDFAAEPFRAVLVAPLTLFIMIMILRLGSENAPLRIAGPSAFIADPPNIGHCPTEDHRIRMFFFDDFACFFVVVICHRIDRTFLIGTTIPAVAAIRPVKPELEERSIVRRQFTYLVMVRLHVSRTTVFGMIPIPRREINTKLQVIFLTRFGKIAYHIALAVSPWRIFHTVFRGFRRPEAKTVMVLRRNDNTSESGGLDDARPLIAIQIFRIKCRCGRITIAPFKIVERIQPKMYKSIHLRFMPGNLLRRRNRQNRRRSFENSVLTL